MKYYEILPTHTETPRNTTRKIANLYIEFNCHFLTLQKKIPLLLNRSVHGHWHDVGPHLLLHLALSILLYTKLCLWMITLIIQCSAIITQSIFSQIPNCCWCPGSLHHTAISSHNIDYADRNNFSYLYPLSTEKETMYLNIFMCFLSYFRHDKSQATWSNCRGQQRQQFILTPYLHTEKINSARLCQPRCLCCFRGHYYLPHSRKLILYGTEPSPKRHD